MRKHQIALRNAVLLPGFLVASTGYVARYTVTRGDHPLPNGGITGDRSLREARGARREARDAGRGTRLWGRRPLM